ncbi:hypothetical protein [Salinigranum halophilum]|uniref:hypothetical protein n=1 Tax=Salinigranum halophilum TaxID=2565931 RepID=UPI00115EBAC2|nr:hypothetical protein [Salinigranum halophilum]
MRRRDNLALCAGVLAVVAGCSRNVPGASATATTTDGRRETQRRSPHSPTATTTHGETPSAQGPAPAPHLGWFVLWNDGDERHRVGITVSRDGEVLVDERRDLGPGAAADVDNPIETQGVYSVVATVDGRERAEREWQVTNCESVEYLQVYVEDTDAVTIRTMRQTVDPPPTC